MIDEKYRLLIGYLFTAALIAAMFYLPFRYLVFDGSPFAIHASLIAGFGGAMIVLIRYLYQDEEYREELEKADTESIAAFYRELAERLLLGVILLVMLLVQIMIASEVFTDETMSEFNTAFDLIILEAGFFEVIALMIFLWMSIPYIRHHSNGAFRNAISTWLIRR